jgi:hypothetical protein
MYCLFKIVYLGYLRLFYETICENSIKLDASVRSNMADHLVLSFFAYFSCFFNLTGGMVIIMLTSVLVGNKPQI